MSYDIVRLAPPDVRFRSVVHALGIIVAAFVAGIGLALVGLEVLAALGYTSEADPLLVSVVATSLQFVGFILAVVGYLAWADEWDLIPFSLPDVSDVAWMVGGFVGVFVAALVVSVLVTLLGLESAENAAVVAGRENPELFLWLVPIAILFVGPGEELVFRGVVQGQLRRAFGPVPAIVLASVLFGAVHMVALVGSGQLVYVAIAGALGLVLGTIYETSRNVLVPAVVHGLWNAMLFLINWYAVVYDVPTAA